MKSMDDLSDLLSPQAVQAALVVPNKKALFHRLVERERLGSTGFGGGVAIPHGKIEGLNRVVGLFARLGNPIDFAAIDDLPVDLVFLLLSPVDAGVEHLKALARVSRRMRDKGFVAKLRGAGSDDALYALFATGETRHAA
jgi:PTS system nitrogen regulatory IIA component